MLPRQHVFRGLSTCVCGVLWPSWNLRVWFPLLPSLFSLLPFFLPSFLLSFHLFFFPSSFLYSLSYVAIFFPLWKRKAQRVKEGHETHGLFMLPWFYKWKLEVELEKSVFLSPIELQSLIWSDLHTPGKPGSGLFVDSLIKRHGGKGHRAWRFP